MEQHDPCAQFPQIVPPFADPQVPSVVTLPVAVGFAEVLTLTTGSPVKVCVAVFTEVGPLFLSVVVIGVSVHPLWQPCDASQWAVEFPQ